MTREEYKGKTYELRNAPEGCELCCFDENTCMTEIGSVPLDCIRGEAHSDYVNNYWVEVKDDV